MKRIPGKWIDGLGPDDVATDAARRVLHLRLKAVEEMLPRAEHESGDVRNVHQLRVATRRADAALRLFGACLPKRRYRKARRRLRSIRQAAGLARVCDVHARILSEHRSEADELQQVVFDDLLKSLRRERKGAQKHIREVARDYPVKRLRKMRRRLLKAVHDPVIEGVSAPPRFSDLARRCLPDLLEAVHVAASEDLSVLPNLHALRLRGKRLRYAMELFAPCLGEGFGAAYSEVEGLQESLGDINDCHEIIERIGSLLERSRGSNGASRGGLSPHQYAHAGYEVVEQYRRRQAALVASFLEDWAAGGWDRMLGVRVGAGDDRTATASEDMEVSG